MQVRKLKFLLVVVTIVVLSSVAYGQAKGVPVDIPGTGVNFFLYRYEGQSIPHQEINAIWANLSEVFAQWVRDGRNAEALSGKDVKILTNTGMVAIFIKDQFIVAVDEYHASANAATKAQLAEKWAVNLRQGVDKFVAINGVK